MGIRCARFAEKSIDIIRRYQSANGAYVACPNFDNTGIAETETVRSLPMLWMGQAFTSLRSFYKWVHGVIHSQAAALRAVGMIKTGRILIAEKCTDTLHP